VAAFRVTGIREQTAKQPEPRLVGRDDELAALSETLDGLLEGRGSIISITGEPGIGKSRLVAEVKERFDRQVRFLAGHAVSYAETIAYWPIRELLLGWLDLGISDPEARTRLELRAELTRSLAEAGDAHPGREQGLNGAPGPRQPRLSSHPLLRFGGNRPTITSTDVRVPEGCLPLVPGIEAVARHPGTRGPRRRTSARSMTRLAHGRLGFGHPANSDVAAGETRPGALPLARPCRDACRPRGHHLRPRTCDAGSQHPPHVPARPIGRHDPIRTVSPRSDAGSRGRRSVRPSGVASRRRVGTRVWRAPPRDPARRRARGAR
jgi:hypothetical protein